MLLNEQYREDIKAEVCYYHSTKFEDEASMKLRIPNIIKTVYYREKKTLQIFFYKGAKRISVYMIEVDMNRYAMMKNSTSQSEEWNRISKAKSVSVRTIGKFELSEDEAEDVLFQYHKKMNEKFKK